VAVKVVLPLASADLETEFQILETHKDKNLPLVKPCSPISHSDAGAGYCMQPVGVAVSRTELLKQFPGSYRSFLSVTFDVLLLLHDAGVIHGDPRSVLCLRCAQTSSVCVPFVTASLQAAQFDPAFELARPYTSALLGRS
jgi:hypothetical protein